MLTAVPAFLLVIRMARCYIARAMPSGREFLVWLLVGLAVAVLAHQAPIDLAAAPLHQLGFRALVGITGSGAACIGASFLILRRHGITFDSGKDPDGRD